MKGLEGKRVVVTGGTSGIGEATSRRFLEEGAQVVALAVGADEIATAAERIPGLAAARRCDVADEAQVAEAFAAVDELLGGVDVLVANAGISIRKPFLEIEEADWRRVLDVNLTGAFLCSQAAGNVMIAQGGGKIINIASVAGLGGAMPEVLDSIAYNTSKGGLVNFTRDLAVKWGRHKINVNAIAPGWFPSKMSSAIVERWGDRLARTIPLGRIGGDEDLKGTIVYLASRASDYITGQILAVDGGHTAS